MRPLMIVALTLVTTVMTAAPGKDEKLKPEQLIAKHLESIGPAAKLKEIKNRATTGMAHFQFVVGGSGNSDGQGTLLSTPNAMRATFMFPLLDYRGEEFVTDGDKVSIAQISPGVRSPIGTFFYENDWILKDGLLFGALSTSWALLNPAAKEPKLDATGLKKINGRELYELRYQPRRFKGSVQAALYFDPQTFRHVRTQYKLELPAPAATRITDSAELIRYLVIEEYDQFQETDGLTLPHSYKLEFSVEGPGRGFVGNWSYAIRDVGHNQTLDPQLFIVK